MTDLFPDDYVIQVRNSLIEELNKVPAVQYIDVAVFTSKFVYVLRSLSFSCYNPWSDPFLRQ